MLITAIKIRKFEDTQTKLLGVADITLDDMIVIHDIKILKSSEGMFLAMPSRTLKNNTFKDIVHPINKNVRAVFERLIFAAYAEADSHMYAQLSLKLSNDEISSLYEEYIDDFSALFIEPEMYF